jgi:WD40 repeat protein
LPQGWWLRRLSVAPDGSSLAALPLEINGVALRDRSGEVRVVLEGDKVNEAAFGPDGRLLAAGCLDGTLILWDVAEGRVLARVKAHTGPIVTLAVSPDGTRVATGAVADPVVRVWGAPGGELLLTPRGNHEGIASLAFSPDGSLLGSASNDGIARFWDTTRGRERAAIGGADIHIQALAFSPDGRAVATGGFDRTLRFWDLAEVLGAAR